MFDPINYSLTRQSTGIISRLAKITQDNLNGTFEVLTIDDLPQSTFTAYGLGDQDFEIDNEVMITLIPNNSTSIAYIGTNIKEVVIPTDDITIGTPTDGTYEGGLVALTSSDTIADAFDAVNLMMADLHPLAPYLGQPSNSIGDGRVSFVPSSNIASDYISNGNGYYNTGGNENTIQTIFRKGVFHEFRTGSWIRGIEVGTIFRLKYNGAVVDTLTITDPTINESSTNMYFSNSRQNVSGGWEKQIHFQINLNAELPNGGWFSLGFEQELPSILHTDSYSGFFSDHRDVVVNSFIVNLNNLTSTTHLSGLNFIKSGDYTVGWNVTNLFYESYRNTPIALQLNGIGASNKNYSRTEFLPIIYNDPAVKSYAANIAGIDIQTDTITASISATNTFSNDSENFSGDFLLNTYGNVSNESDDTFRDENYRLETEEYDTLPTSLTGNWNSAQSLLTNDGLQILDGLFYPDKNYSIHYPLGNPNYSTISDNRFYSRALRLSGMPKTNGVITLNGMDYNQLGTTWEAHIKLPGLTGWLDLSQPYDSASFTGADGDGIHISHTTNSITYTTGGFSTGLTDFTIIVRIMMKNICNLKISRMIYS